MSISKYLEIDDATTIPHGTKTVLIWCRNYADVKETMHSLMEAFGNTAKASFVNNNIDYLHMNWKLFVDENEVLAYDRNRTVLLDWRNN